MKKVIDLSAHNRIPTDWTAVKHSVDGVILRCGYRGYGTKGTLVEDKKFRQFRDACIGTKGIWYDHQVSVSNPQPIEAPAN